MLEKKTVLLLESNLFFLAKVSAIVQNNGLAAKRASNSAQIKTIDTETVVLIIVNLLAPGIKSLELISEIKKDKTLRNAPLIGFAGHLATELMQRAQELGCDRVLSNGALIANLPEILKQITKN